MMVIRNLSYVQCPRQRVADVAAAFLATLAAAACQAEDWPRFLGPAGTGVSTETGLLAAWPADGPRVLWKKAVGEGYAAPSVRGKRVVFFHRIGDEEVTECLAADTGAVLWRQSHATRFVDPYGYNGGPRCTPLLTADRCYTHGAEGALSCLDLATGAVLWQRQTGRDFDVPPAFFGVGSTPVLEDDRLIVMVGGHPRAGVVAFDATTGKTLWQAVGPDDFPEPPRPIQRDRPPVKLASYASPHVVTIHGRRHVLCLMRPGLVSLDPATGAINFAVSFRSRLHDSVNAAQPVMIDDRVFLTAAYDTGAMLLEIAADGRSARIVWQDDESMQCHWSTPIARDGHLYGFSGRNESDSDLRCVRAGDGKVMWREPGDTPADAGTAIVFGRGSAILANGRLIAMGERGTLALLEVSPRGLREISRATFAELSSPCWTAPVLSHGRLFITGARPTAGRDGLGGYEYHLMALDLSAAP
jgi:outer membrane protein assembly factor BamB